MVLWRVLTIASVLLFGVAAEGASGNIKKVLPFYLDTEARQSLSPSLYERDAYQAVLRANPEKCSGLRFDVLWKGPRRTELTVRVEMRGSRSNETTRATIEAPLRYTGAGVFSRWSSVTLTGDKYRQFGELVAWRATLWWRDKLLDEERSFLW